MLDTELRPSGEADTPRLASGRALSIVLTLVMLALGLIVAAAYVGMPLDDPSLVESTPGQLALWLAARNNLDEAATLGTARIALVGMSLLAAGLSGGTSTCAGPLRTTADPRRTPRNPS